MGADWPEQEEIARLELMHSVLSKVFDDRLIFPPVHAPERILDCGCGACDWAVDVAEHFPDSEVLGIDISPHMIPEDLPNNLEIQIDDLNGRFTFPTDHFDVVHSRLMASGIHANRWRSYVQDIFRVLKPGGWCQMVEIYFNAQSDNGTLERGQQRPFPVVELVPGIYAPSERSQSSTPAARLDAKCGLHRGRIPAADPAHVWLVQRAPGQRYRDGQPGEYSPATIFDGRVPRNPVEGDVCPRLWGHGRSGKRRGKQCLVQGADSVKAWRIFREGNIVAASLGSVSDLANSCPAPRPIFRYTFASAASLRDRGHNGLSQHPREEPEALGFKAVQACFGSRRCRGRVPP
ncbi:hypothetical protein Purlil1_4620 [Purpureocillium lilacinum]|uniref:Methyltransferase domain-containing protein n=1 Tax=Purpureocillium lilacinum TaxID=33203 RepID=A0ABR0C495_PURLI|nr:hypothetical protein Purlil1_4620 [Purpureocillium lilacinum]